MAKLKPKRKEKPSQGISAGHAAKPRVGVVTISPMAATLTGVYECQGFTTAMPIGKKPIEIASKKKTTDLMIEPLRSLQKGNGRTGNVNKRRNKMRKADRLPSDRLFDF